MRVEQRIGRIDRIGQVHKEVWISNYFYKDTIEDQIYQRLADRINWFEVVVGDLQPILAEVGEATRRLAMLPPTEREVQLEKEIAALKQRLQNREVESLNLDDYLEEDSFQPGPASPVTLEQIEYLFTKSQATGHLFHPHPELPGVYLLSWKGESLPVTFNPKVFDEHPDTVRFLSYGNPLLVELLDSVPVPDVAETASLVRCQLKDDIELRGWFIPALSEGTTERMDTFLDLRDWLESHKDKAIVSSEILDQAKTLLQIDYEGIRQGQADIIQHRRKAEYLTQRVKAQSLLLRAAMVEIALGKSPEILKWIPTIQPLMNRQFSI